MKEVKTELDFFKGKRILVTGHTGFKGTWMCKALIMLGADVIGYAKEPPTKPSLYNISGISQNIVSILGDIRDVDNVCKTVKKYRPEIVIHMAAQPIVLESYKNPLYTYQTNVMGTVNICEAIRLCDCVRSFINITTDKVYCNKEWEWGYRENDFLDGYDPYSNSKSCSELVTSSYKRSFFSEKAIAVSTCRAGNVIGGGDFAQNRIIPDCVKAAQQKKQIEVRNPYSIRPYQYVLEPVMLYLCLAEKQYKQPKLGDSYNIGPEDCDCISTGELVDLFCDVWGEGLTWKNVSKENQPHEANFLKLDSSKIKTTLGWKPNWNIRKAVEGVVEWSKGYIAGKDINPVMEKQIEDYIEYYKEANYV